MITLEVGHWMSLTKTFSKRSRTIKKFDINRVSLVNTKMKRVGGHKQLAYEIYWVESKIRSSNEKSFCRFGEDVKAIFAWGMEGTLKMSVSIISWILRPV
jgi:hypothetical protein